MVGLDGWHVKPTGNWADDYQTGGWFAEDAVFWSRIMGVGFLNFVLASLVAKGPAILLSGRVRVSVENLQLRPRGLVELRKETSWQKANWNGWFPLGSFPPGKPSKVRRGSKDNSHVDTRNYLSAGRGDDADRGGHDGHARCPHHRSDRCARVSEAETRRRV